MKLAIFAASFLLGMIVTSLIWLYDARERTRLSASLEDVLNNLTEKEKWDLFYGDPEFRMFSTSMGMTFKERPADTVTSTARKPSYKPLYGVPETPRVSTPRVQVVPANEVPYVALLIPKVPTPKVTAKKTPGKPKPVKKVLPKPPVAKPKTPKRR